MTHVIRNMVEYYNQNDYMYPDMKYFKQINIDSRKCIPIEKQNIKQIIKVMSEAKIINQRAIKTPKGKSLEGEVLTGNKLLVEGILLQQIQYIADIPQQPIHAAYFETHFITYIVLPEDFNSYVFVTASAFIDDVSAIKENKRCVYLCTTLLITAEL